MQQKKHQIFVCMIQYFLGFVAYDGSQEKSSIRVFGKCVRDWPAASSYEKGFLV